MTVAETPSFIREAGVLMTQSEHDELVLYVAANPESGAIMPDTGGVRKLRWAAKGKGRRGGIRVIYYYYSDLIPLFLLNVYAKSEKDNLSRTERNEMKKLIPRLVAGYQRRIAR